MIDITDILDERHRAVRLEVVDTNTGARQLYERLGFTLVTTQHYPLVRSWLGFSGDHVMVKELLPVQPARSS